MVVRTFSPCTARRMGSFSDTVPDWVLMSSTRLSTRHRSNCSQLWSVLGFNFSDRWSSRLKLFDWVPHKIRTIFCKNNTTTSAIIMLMAHLKIYKKSYIMPEVPWGFKAKIFQNWIKKSCWPIMIISGQTHRVIIKSTHIQSSLCISNHTEFRYLRVCMHVCVCICVRTH